MQCLLNGGQASCSAQHMHGVGPVYTASCPLIGERGTVTDLATVACIVLFPSISIALVLSIE